MIFFFKQKTAYEMRISDWSSDVCSSDLSDSSVANARCGCPPLRERLPLVELCGFDHLAHLASIADRCVSLGPLFVAYGDAAGPDFDARFFGTRKPGAVDRGEAGSTPHGPHGSGHADLPSSVPRVQAPSLPKALFRD